ncbi:MAG: PAS domain-containing protein [Chlorobi bacterium]|nr:PAS domain-containing protein [Chlorobiota bacterium]
MKLNLKIIISVLLIASIFLIAILALIPVDNIINYAENNILKVSIIIAIIVLFIILLIFIAINSIYRPINKIKNTISDINSGIKNKNIDLPTTRNDEIGEIYKELNNCKESLILTSKYASKLKKNKLDDEDDETIKNNIIGKELIEIKENSITIQKENEYRAEENKKTQWYQEGIANFSALLQQDFNDINSLSEASIKMLVKYLNVEQAGIFILQEKNNKKLLVLEATYAFDKKKQLNSEFEIGESLVGKCAKERKLIKIDDLPEGYTFIGSGLGEDTPKTLLLVPLIFEKTLFGVIEIASLHKIPEYKINFILEVGKRIAANIANIQRKYASQKLTEQLKKQADELKEKEKEALSTIEELKKAQDEIAKQAKENLEIMNALVSVVSVVFYDLDGRIIDINQKNQALFNIKKEDYIGKTHFDFLPEAKENPEWFIQFWEDIRNGKTRTKEYFIKQGDKEMWLHETFTAILNEKGEPEKVINIGVDITKQKQLELELIKLKQNN